MENSSLQINSLKFDFRSVINDHLKSKDRCVINYFNLILNDLKQISLEQKNFQNIYRSHLSIYLDLPIFLAERIESILKTRKEIKYLTPSELINFLMDFYFSPLQKFEKFIFNIIDLNNNNYVVCDNTLIILKFLCKSEETYKIFLPIAKTFFENDEKMDYDEFQIQNKNLPEFLGAFFILFYFKFPLDLEVLHSLIEKEYSSEQISITKLLEQSKSHITEYYEYLYRNGETEMCSKVPEIFRSSQNFSSSSNSQIKFPSYNASSKKNFNLSTYNEKLSEKHSSITLSNYIMNREEIRNFSNDNLDYVTCEIYDKLSKKFMPVRLTLTNKFLVSQKIKVTQNYPSHMTFEIINLSAYFPHLNKNNELLTFGINNREFSVSFFPRKCQIIPSINRVFFFKSKLEMELFYETISSLINYQSFSTIYYPGDLIYQNDNVKTYAGLNIKSKLKVAIKIIDKNKIEDDSLNFLISENDIAYFFKNFPYEYIVNPIDIMEDKNYLYYIMEFIEGITLKNFIDDDIIDHSPMDEIEVIIKQVSMGIDYLHSNGIIHRDIKPENIILKYEDEKFKVKLIDFGFSKVIGINGKVSGSLGTMVYSAPEVFIQKYYDNKIDVWSFGVVLYLLFNKMLPFENINGTQEQLINSICRQNKLLFRIHLNVKVKSLIKNCLKKNANLRFSIKDVLEFEL
jgi:hypothetical protein